MAKQAGLNYLIPLSCGMWLLASGLARADANCEKRILDTGMIVVKGDEKIACGENPSKAAQDCMVELLTKGKGKLRTPDFLEINALCRTNSSKGLVDCVTKRLSKSWNDPGYQSMHIIGDQCTNELRGISVKHYPTQKEQLDSLTKHFTELNLETAPKGQTQVPAQTQEQQQGQPAAEPAQAQPNNVPQQQPPAPPAGH